MAPGIDAIEFELFKNALFSIADEMALTVHRTTYSAVLKDNMDYSTAFCDADGRLVAQGLTLPSHLGSIPEALAAVMRSATAGAWTHRRQPSSFASRERPGREGASTPLQL